jgi:hypothetical protein
MVIFLFIRCCVSIDPIRVSLADYSKAQLNNSQREKNRNASDGPRAAEHSKLVRVVQRFSLA